ncbi:hypothetical protein EV182_005953, partial [Spiromyces aspiralis]
MTVHGHPSRPGPLDELVIKPGATRSIMVSVRHVNEHLSNDVNAGHLTHHTFILRCEYVLLTQSQLQSRIIPKESEHISIPCSIHTCTSIVQVQPSVLDFGQVDVGTLESLYAKIENLSDVAATVQCRVDSKVINCKRTLITIPPQSEVSLRVDIYPRRTNARYRKQINLINYKNRSNDQIIDVRSEHIDRRRMTFHNLFYRTLVPDNEQNFLDLGMVPLNSPILRVINLKNKCKTPIALTITPSDGRAFRIFRIMPAASAVTATPEIVAAAHKLRQMEKETEFHSHRDRFKEFASDRLSKHNNLLGRNPIINNGPPRHSHRGSIAMISSAERVWESKPPLPSRQQLRASPSSTLVRKLEPDMFVDKTVEKSHACLVPFTNKQSYKQLDSAIDYLDAASPSSRIAKRRPIIRIRRAPLAKDGSSDSKPLGKAAHGDEGDGDTASANGGANGQSTGHQP